jgi:hypothetical protein
MFLKCQQIYSNEMANKIHILLGLDLTGSLFGKRLGKKRLEKDRRYCYRSKVRISSARGFAHSDNGAKGPGWTGVPPSSNPPHLLLNADTS